MTETAEPKSANPGALMLKRSDAVGLVRKLIALAHDEANDVGENGSVEAFRAVRRKIAAYYTVLDHLNDVPVFVNSQRILVRSPDETELQPVENRS